MTLLQLLENGKITEFNEQRGQRRPPDLFAADLSGLDLRNVDFSGANLEKADLTGANLTGAMLNRTNLNGADLSETILVDVRGLRARFRDAWMEDADLSGADFTGGDFNGAVLNRVKAVGACFRTGKLKGAEMKESDFSEVDFSECKLSRVDLSAAKLDGTIFVDAKLVGADLTRASMVGVNLTKVRGNEAIFSHANLTRAKMVDGDFSEADFGGSKLNEVDLTGADLAQAELAGANMNSAVLTNTRLDGVELTDEQKSSLSSEGAASEEDVKVDDLMFHEAQVARIGDTVAVLWENETPSGAISLRLAVVGANGDPTDIGVALPVPAELVLARGIAATDMGFVVASFIQRPSGMVVMFSEVSAMGELGTTRTHELGYDPAVKPVITSNDSGDVIIYGLARRGPSVFVHKYDGGELELVKGEKASTARGFVGDHRPILVTKGGALVGVGLKGLGKPLACPEGFPGRNADVGFVGDGVLVTWVPKGKKGYCWSQLVPGEKPEVEIESPSKQVTEVKVIQIDGAPYIVYTKEQEGELSPVGVYAKKIPDGREFSVLVGPDVDVESVITMADSTGRLACQTFGDQMVFVDVDHKKGDCTEWSRYPVK